jgi:hypothetical protein
MNKFLTIALLVFAFGVAKAQAVTVAIPAPQAHKVTLNWTNNCTTAVPCVIIPYRVVGSCPSAGATTWTALPATAVGAVTTQDTTVAAGQTYSYEVEAVSPTDATNVSNPSNCITVTIPNAPADPTTLTGK